MWPFDNLFRPRSAVFPALEGRFVLPNLTVVNPTVSRQAGQDLTIADGKIESIGNTGPTVQMSDYAGYYALPGLIDMHMHLPGRAMPGAIKHAALLYLLHGVTTLRDAGDLDGSAVPAFLELEASDGAPAPRIFFCGPFVGAGSPTFKNTILIEDPGDATSVARRVKALGASFMKLHDGLSIPMIRALEEACADVGLRTMGHVPRDLAYEDALVKETQHFFGAPPPDSLDDGSLRSRNIRWQRVDADRIKRLVDATLDYAIANTPTLVTLDSLFSYRDYERSCRMAAGFGVPEALYGVVWSPTLGTVNARVSDDERKTLVPMALEKKQHLLKALHEAGADLFLGTDTMQPFVIAGAALHREMALFVDAGLETEEVWRLATAAAADRLGADGLGRLAPGAPADMLLFEEDPTSNLARLDSLRAVVSDGRLYRVEDLRAAVDAMGRFYRNPIVRSRSVAQAKKIMAQRNAAPGSR